VTQFADAEREAVRPFELFDPLGIVVAHSRAPRILLSGEKALMAPAILQ
jgi:hypothetical protein